MNSKKVLLCPKKKKLNNKLEQLNKKPLRTFIYDRQEFNFCFFTKSATEDERNNLKTVAKFNNQPIFS